MNFAQIKTDYIHDHLARALDELRRMGFRLHGVDVEVLVDGVARMRVEFEPDGNLGAHVFIDRLRRMVGISELTHGLVKK